MAKHVNYRAALVALLWLWSPTAFAQWVTTEFDTVTRMTGEYRTFHQSIAIDEDGTLYAIWHNLIRSPRLDKIEISSKLAGGEWRQPVVIADSLVVAAIVRDAQTSVSHIFIRDQFNVFRLTHLYHIQRSLSETHIELVAVDSLRVSPHSVFIDRFGFLHVAWATEVSPAVFRIAYANNVNGQWQKEIVEPSDPGRFGAGSDPQIVITPRNDIVIAYVNRSFAGANTFLAIKKEDQSWQMDFVPFSGNDFGESFVDIATDSKSGLHVAVSGWEGEDLGGKNYYFFRSSDGSWQGPEELPESLAPISILIQTDRNDMPHVIWEKWAFFASGEIYYSYKDDNDNWHSQLIVDIGLREPVYPSFVIDAEGNGHLLMINYPVIRADTVHVVYMKSQSLVTGVSSQTSERAVPETFELSPSFPNPFSSSASMRYRLSAPVETVVQVFALSGELVTTISNTVQQPGEYAVRWNGKDHFEKEVSAGVYFIKLILVNSHGTQYRVAKTLKLD